MAFASTCLKCGGSSFELGDIEIKDANFKLYAVRCSNCGGVVCVIEAENITNMLLEQNRALKKWATKQGTTLTLRG